MIYEISYTLRIRFDKINEFTRVSDGGRCLVLFGLEKYYAIYNRIGYLKSLKSYNTNRSFSLLCEN